MINDEHKDLPTVVSDLDRLSEETRKQNLKRLEESNRECLELYMDSIREIDLHTYMNHYRYRLYAYFRYGIDLVFHIKKRKSRSIVEEWQALIGKKTYDPETKQYILSDDSLFSQVKLTDGSGNKKEVVTILPSIMAELREKDIRKVDTRKLIEVVMDARSSGNLHPGMKNAIISKEYGAGFSKLAPVVAPDDLKFEHAREWVKKIEEIDSWFRTNYPKLANKLVPLPTLEDVNNIINSANEDKPIETVKHNVAPVQQGRSKFTVKRNYDYEA